MNNRVKRMTISAIIAALYFAVCAIPPVQFMSGAIQCRIGEGLCLLPLFFPEAIIGVTVGCLIYNAIFCTVWDVVLGTLATLCAALCTYFIGKLFTKDYLKIIVGGFFPVIFNACIVPAALKLCGFDEGLGYWFLFLTVGLGEAVAVYVIGSIIYFPMKKLLQNYSIIEDTVSE